MSLIPDRHNFTIWAGTTFREFLTLFTDDAGTTPWDLGGYTANLTIKQSPNGLTLLAMTTENGRIVLDGATGNIQLYISATDTGLLTWQTGVYDFTITAGGGDTNVLLFGGFTVKGI